MIWGNMFLPIDSYGDGISQVLLLAYHLVAGDRIVALIDEPELGLHPAAQRRLLGALCGASVEQFIATTHSPVFLDAFAGQSLVRVSQQDGVPQFSLPLLHSELSETLDDIGARPSDILQANVAIWVEGPSDRIFLLACLGLVAPDLKEGVHFQIVFYGGKVGTHLAFDDTPDGVNVLRMCRRAVIIMDSDCDSEGMEIAEWKQRIVEAVKQAGGWSWVTAGREIENYLHSDLLSHCYGEWWGMKVTVANSQWLRLHDTLCTVAMDSCPKSWWRYSDHKVEHMRRIASCLRDEHLDTLDLRVRVIELVEKIRGWN